MGFQADIDSANATYRSHGIANVRRNKEDWVFSGDPGRNAHYAPSRWARTDDGRRMRRAKSDVDYRGGGRGYSIAFDAKETALASLPLRNIEASQIETLCLDERCGVIAGFLIHFSRDGAVYWIGATKVRDAYDKAKYQPDGKAAHPKSLSREWLAEHGTLVETPRSSLLRVDYLRAVAPGLFSSSDSAGITSGAGVG